MMAQNRPATPVPFGVQAATGRTRGPITPFHPDHVVVDRRVVRQRHLGPGAGLLALVPSIEPANLRQTGWGVVFASDVDPAVREALQPLLALREAQVGDAERFRVFEGSAGVQPGQTAAAWLAVHGVGLATVDPENGVPYYLLLAGPPDRISFEFQYTLDLHWCVGRLDFESAEGYAAYAAKVVACETGKAARQRLDKAAIWMPANEGDMATTLLCTDVGLPFVQKPLGEKQGFTLRSHLGPDATKASLLGELASNASVLFTGSHGLEMANAADFRERQGALVTQEWVAGTPVEEDAYLSAKDLPADLDLSGLVHVMFACFGGGCPTHDNYPESPPDTLRQISEKPFVARLPQAMLQRGALAVMAHIDRAWSYSFQSGIGLPQSQVLRSVLEVILQGKPIGLAADYMNQQWGALAAQLGMLLQPDIDPATLTNLAIARDDARNYAVFGDPAVRVQAAASVIPDGSSVLPS
jgi:hypothetical protein